MIKRSPDSYCLLCQVRNANAKGSHLTPNCLLKHTIGGREDYVAYSIDVEHAEIRKAAGRAAKTADTEIVPNPHVADHILCSVCEEFFALLESEICPELNVKMREERYASQFTVTQVTKDIILKESKKASPNVFNLFIYSVLWRICIQQRFLHYESVIDPRFDQALTTTLLSAAGKTLKEITDLKVILPYPYILVTADKLDITSATFVNPNFEPSNPELFYLGRYLALVYHDFSAASSRVSILPTEVVNNSYVNHRYDSGVKVLFVDEVTWKTVNQRFVDKGAEKYNASKYRGR